MPNGHGFSYPYGFSMVVHPILALAIGAGAGKWWGWLLTGVAAALLVAFAWEAASRSEYEKIRANDPSTTRYSWVVNWLLFFAFPALMVTLWGVAANLRR
ncbi:hypothetical protein [Ramlibacter albus]|uniref:Uncharacterized protein n=1 Tax=Ramlibacter albus TaxID=2079448 RepID=A0A923S1F4_9BURK|nr:hypothetical protein [Ramlibacter albus]MBC5764226.1 hypothetical protein [Ramlibacter albus]